MKRWFYGAAALPLLLGLITAVPTQAGTRAAQLIGAYASTKPSWTSANSTLDPLQTDKFFYQTLSTSYTGTTANGLPGCGAKDGSGNWIYPPSQVTCIITYKTATTNLKSFVRSIPSNRNVILAYCNEPEGTNRQICGGADFLSTFENQTSLIRQYDGDASNIKIAEISEAYQYDPGTGHDNGGASPNCPYIVPPRYLDFYLVDVYENYLTSAQNLGSDPEWNTWVGCTANTSGIARGIAEYAILCGHDPNSPIVKTTIADDDSYLKAHFPTLKVWEYWYSGGCVFTNTKTIAEWQAVEAGN